jgi:hypothetical protein
MGITPVDNSDVHRWGPPFVLVVIGWLGTAAAIWWCIDGFVNGTASEPGTRLFSGLTVLVLAVCTLYGTRARPRLVASSTGIEVCGLRGARRYDWARVADMRLLHTPGLGRKTLTLEITVHTGEPAGHDDELLLIFSRLDLGADPRDVCLALEELAARSRRQGAP